MRKLASIQKISNIRPIEGADKIEVAEVLGWNVVVGKGEFAVGDLAVYFEVDSWLDATDPAFASFEDRFVNWGTKRGMRLKTIKLRKQISQGLLMPIGKFPELKFFSDYHEGADVTEVLKIEKWEPAEETSSNSGGSKASRTRAFPWFLRKTDQERVQNRVAELDKRDEDETFEVTIKLDGSSMTVYAIHRNAPIFEEVMAEREKKAMSKLSKFGRLVAKLKGLFVKPVRPEVLIGVCSRNIELDIEDDNHFSAYVREHGVLDKLRNRILPGEALAFQGELIGPSIQDGYEKVKGFEWHVFDLFDISEQSYRNPQNVRFMTDFFGLSYVPVIEKQFSLPAGTGREKAEALLDMAEGPGMMPGVKREGLVFKSNKQADFSFKAISNSYLLKKG